ncbi:hypothetical protein VP01_2468g3 [Puccinia sorghi]|uniref:Uncharacterized protein n=1 Tax=Puccinia sorghi TaxID=27349 RepID=A0A0L6V629_9BASI|nr:hypothetical protein VP01_2468g3 [Puccinia sorghi]
MTWTSLTLLFGLSLLNSSATAQQQASGLCLDPSLVQQAAKINGITNPANPDKFSKSLISSNNYVRQPYQLFCLLEDALENYSRESFFTQIDFCRGATLTNGAQVPQGSCNPTPMGSIPSVSNMPSVRIIKPAADKVIAPQTDFEVVIKDSFPLPHDIAINLTPPGYFTSPTNTYYLAPQQLNKEGLIKGHLHVVIQAVNGNNVFPADQVSAFKGIADKPVNGELKTTFTGGLPPGFCKDSFLFIISLRAKYCTQLIPSSHPPLSSDRISTITSAKNHQPVLLPVARRGAVDDAIYVRVGTAGGSSSGATKNGNTVQSVGQPSEKTTGHKGKSKKVRADSECRVSTPPFFLRTSLTLCEVMACMMFR